MFNLEQRTGLRRPATEPDDIDLLDDFPRLLRQYGGKTIEREVAEPHCPDSRVAVSRSYPDFMPGAPSNIEQKPLRVCVRPAMWRFRRHISLRAWWEPVRNTSIITTDKHSDLERKFVMRHVETDPASGAEIYQLTNDPRPADNIYGEQPYSDSGSTRIAVRFYSHEGKQGELAVMDLDGGAMQTIIDEMPRFPAFHGWGTHFYCQEMVADELVLRRWDWATLEREDCTVLPLSEGSFSYGTMSPDGLEYAVSIVRESGSRAVLHVDPHSGWYEVIADSEDTYHFKHEQFSSDGADRLLIQANVLPDVTEVHLGTIDLEKGGMTRLACDRPHTPRPTGHEAWIGKTARVFFSTDYDNEKKTNLFTVGVGDTDSEVVVETDKRFGHVSVSRCGNFWIADATRDDGIPIYAGRFGTGTMKQLVASGTVHDDKQWSHTHPYLTADNRWLIYTSTRTGSAQVYGAKVPEDFWRSL